MAAHASGMCEVCGKAASIHLAEIRGGEKVSRSYCTDHLPPDMRDKIPFGPHRTAAEEVALLRRQIAAIEAQVSDPGRRTEFRLEIEQLIADIEAGRRRIGDGV